MKHWQIKIGILLTVFFILLSLTATDNNKSRGKITDFTAKDNPYDDGSGILLSWKPLPDQERIIEYRIYRGVSKDTLFHIGSIEVDPKAGVRGDRLYYYDKNYQTLVDMETAPAKLRKEKGAPLQSPLFAQMPRDIKVIERYLPFFTTLGTLKNSAYFYKSRQITDAEGKTYAGLPLREFTSLVANPIAGNTYFYTLLAVDERGRLLPYADIQSAVPIDDRPDTTAVLTMAYVPEQQKMFFEWQPTIGSPDIYLWSAWLMPRSMMPLYYEQQALNRANAFEGNHAAWQKNAIPLFEIENNYAPVQYYNVDLSTKRITIPPNISEYIPIIGAMDYSGLWAFNTGKDIRIAKPDDLPRLPKFSVGNKRNNKGDTLILSFGKPIAYATKVSYADHAKRKLIVNYELSNNNDLQIANIFFRFETIDGKLLAETTEYYLDRIITTRLPAEYAGIEKFKIRIGFLFKGEQKRTDFYVNQDVSFDVNNKLFIPGNVFSQGENLSNLTYDVAGRSRLSMTYSPGKRVGAISRSYDDVIPYPNDTFKEIQGIDSATGLVKLDHTFTVDLDHETKTTFRASLFRDRFEHDLKTQKQELADLKTRAANTADSAVKDSLEKVISVKQIQLDTILNNKIYTEALKHTNPRLWLRTLQRHAQNNNRTMSYKLIVSDGRGLWAESDPLTDTKGDIKWIMPQPDWFDSTKFITLIGTLLFTLLVVVAVIQSRRGKDFYIRPIAGLHEIDNAVGRATEMGKPILFVPGWGTLGDVCTIASLMILNQVARKSAEYDTRIIVPNCDYMVMPLAQEIVKSAYSEAGRPDAFNQNDVFFISYDQFPYAAGVNGITIRERVATVFYMGFFNAEALLMAETGNACGAIQIAGTDAITQIPFFITTCDYTLMGEEFYAASAYMSHDADLISALKAQDYLKVVIVACILIGTVLSTLNFTGFINAFPIE